MLKYTKEIGSIVTSYFMSTFWQRAVFWSRNLSSELTRITRHYKSETFGQFNIYISHYWAACDPIKKWFESMLKKVRQSVGRSPRRHCVSYLPCRGGIDFCGEEVPASWPWIFRSLKAKTSVFIVYTRFWRNYKLRIEHFRPLKPNACIVLFFIT